MSIAVGMANKCIVDPFDKYESPIKELSDLCSQNHDSFTVIC